jgi:hypothetical protein
LTINSYLYTEIHRNMSNQEIALNWWISLSDQEKQIQLDGCKYVPKETQHVTGLDISYMAIQAKVIDKL